MNSAGDAMVAGVPDRWRTVILRHDLPDGTFHFDWMFEPPAGFPRISTIGPAALVTFRSEVRPDDLQPEAAQIINRMPDHREHYLAYEGPVSGDRGVVRRLREGEITGCRAVPADGNSGDRTGWEFAIQWLEGKKSHESQVIRLAPGPNDRWTMISARQNPRDLSH